MHHNHCCFRWAVVLSLLLGAGLRAEEPPPSVDQAIASAVRGADAIELVRQLPAELPEEACVKLRTLDKQLAGGESAETQALARELLLALGRSGSARSLAYLHEVFEATPARRTDVAVALARFAYAQRRRTEDWRLLVRSLPILDGKDAVEVLGALATFSERGTKPEWQRQVILVGLRGDEETAAAAGRLLQHWTRLPAGTVTIGEGALSKWQVWMAKEYPALPPAELPIDAPNARYTLNNVIQMLGPSGKSNGDAAAGARVLEKALCLKCHRFGGRGEAMGPDLTNARQRFQPREVVAAILYPANNIPEEYASTVVTTRDGRTLTGVVAASGDRVVVLQANGEKASLQRREIEDTQPSSQSAMPSGLLEPLQPQEITDLLAHLFARAAE